MRIHLRTTASLRTRLALAFGLALNRGRKTPHHIVMEELEQPKPMSAFERAQNAFRMTCTWTVGG